MANTPTAPRRSPRGAAPAPRRLERDQRRTLSTTTRTCNTVADVYMSTGRASDGGDWGPWRTSIEGPLPARP